MNDETKALVQKLISEIRLLNETAKVLDKSVAGFRTHTDSTGYFLKIAVEDMTKAVNSMQLALKKALEEVGA